MRRSRCRRRCLTCRPAAIALFPWEETREPIAARRAGGGGRAGWRRRRISEVRLFIGPEGGFSPGEAALAARSGARLVTLGRRILRAETAAIVASALALDTLGALG